MHWAETPIVNHYYTGIYVTLSLLEATPISRSK